jgi:hypothetical protein
MRMDTGPARASGVAVGQVLVCYPHYTTLFGFGERDGEKLAEVQGISD